MRRAYPRATLVGSLVFEQKHGVKRLAAPTSGPAQTHTHSLQPPAAVQPPTRCTSLHTAAQRQSSPHKPPNQQVCVGMIAFGCTPAIAAACALVVHLWHACVLHDAMILCTAIQVHIGNAWCCAPWHAPCCPHTVFCDTHHILHLTQAPNPPSMPLRNADRGCGVVKRTAQQGTLRVSHLVCITPHTPHTHQSTSYTTAHAGMCGLYKLPYDEGECLYAVCDRHALILCSMQNPCAFLIYRHTRAGGAAAAACSTCTRQACACQGQGAQEQQLQQTTRGGECEKQGQRIRVG